MFVRTKDKIIAFGEKYAYPTRLSNGKTYFSFKELTEDRFDVMKEYNHWEILNQSENLEELCDEFVIENKVGNFDKSYVIHYNMPNHIFTEPTAKEKIAYIKKYYKDELDKIRGAIYTDKGLIYVAKLNQNGELVLI